MFLAAAITIIVLDILIVAWFHAIASHADEVWDDTRTP